VAIALPGSRTVLTVHDLNRLDHLKGVRLCFFKWLYFIIPLWKCQVITCISDCTRTRLLQRFPWVEPKVRVIANCVPAGYKPVPRPFNVSRPRLLQVGTGPNKNLERVAAALAGQECLLHIIGALTEDQRSLLRRAGVEYENQVDVSDADMHRAYVDADAVIFISLAEGFGLPIIEANVIGRPVITSNREPMCDVAGSAACLVDPLNTEDVRRGIRRIIRDEAYREQLIRNGYTNAARFSVSAVAEQYADLYREIIARNRTIECRTAAQTFRNVS
jgi:glycosyltransferase involved in cell wall biosynthesis